MIRNSSSIFSSKTTIILKRLISSALVIAILGGLISVLNTMYFEESEWEHILWKSFYEQENIDNIFIGASHVYCDVNPYILDELNGMNNFNLSTGALTLGGAYYYLREASQRYSLKNAYIELYYSPNCGTNSACSLGTLKNNWRQIFYFRESLNKYEYAVRNMGNAYYLEPLIPFVRYRSRLFDGDFINKVKDRKNSEWWKTYKFKSETDTETVEFMEKGFMKNSYIMDSNKLYFFETQMDLKSKGLMTFDNCEYMQQIIDYCKRNGINLKFFIAPFFEEEILSTRDYDSYYHQVLSIAQENDVELYDFNYVKKQYLDVVHQQYYIDNGHMNETGASIFTPFLWKVLSNSYNDNRLYFYDTYDEKISEGAPHLYGIYYDDYFKKGKNCTFASNTDNELEYYAAFVTEAGENITIKEFSTNKEFTIPYEFNDGVLCVESRKKNDKRIVDSFRIELERK